MRILIGIWLSGAIVLGGLGMANRIHRCPGDLNHVGVGAAAAVSALAWPMWLVTRWSLNANGWDVPDTCLPVSDAL